MYVDCGCRHSKPRLGFLGAVPLINQGGGAYNKPPASSPVSDITNNPVVYSNPYTAGAAVAVKVLKGIGVHIDPKSPSQHIKERSATIAALTAAALNGDNNAWAQIWSLSSRPLPVRASDEVPKDLGPDCKKLPPGTCSTSGKRYPCPAGCTTNPFHGSPRVGDVADEALRQIEAARGIPRPGNTTQGQPSTVFPAMPGAPAASPITAALGDVGGTPLVATLGFLALAFLLKGR